MNDKTGNKGIWPFDSPPLSQTESGLGGDWGGTMGVDEMSLPAVYEIDYVCVYQISQNKQ